MDEIDIKKIASDVAVAVVKEGYSDLGKPISASIGKTLGLLWESTFGLADIPLAYVASQKEISLHRIETTKQKILSQITNDSSFIAAPMEIAGPIIDCTPSGQVGQIVRYC